MVITYIQIKKIIEGNINIIIVIRVKKLLSTLFMVAFTNRNSTTVGFSGHYAIKDVAMLMIVLALTATQTHFNVLLLAHPDNRVEVNALVTPLHIVPEWYFLPFYGILKSVPAFVPGLLLFISSITFMWHAPQAGVSSVRMLIAVLIYLTILGAYPSTVVLALGILGYTFAAASGL